MQWIVDVAYPTDPGRFISTSFSDAVLDDIAAKFDARSVSAGSGFGMRDIQYAVSNKRRAISLCDRLARELKVPEDNGEPRDMMSTEPYASFYREPESILGYLLYYRDFREFWRVFRGKLLRDE